MNPKISIDKDTFSREVIFHGVKGLIYIGNKIIVFRRDGKTKNFPFQVDLPGGGREENESPFETFKREVKEEFGLEIKKEEMIFSKKYPSIADPNIVAYFIAVRLESFTESDIKFGDEGLEYFLIEPQEYVTLDDGVKQQRYKVDEFLKTESDFFLKRDNFKRWIAVKQKVHENQQYYPKFNEGDVWWVSVGENIGSEIVGKGSVYTRPVLVLRKFSSSMFLGIPLTSKEKGGDWYVEFKNQGETGYAVLVQVRTFSARRLYTRMYQMDEMDFAKIKTAFLELISLNFSPDYGSRGKSPNVNI
jgi:8-oxo-dGTP pyrophosphatase MutT (NUDIX family)/mRNA-degrading endonuclease toxin of MazEF toxin-antitoxin module